ncbi:MAG TPA: isoprenylcysteine carboxylmethyltransferase family protein [Labilithrix sp.]|nr:isoprenylcysteine carboxylmethyltransferase family protein [Labilithrix sp.]
MSAASKPGPDSKRAEDGGATDDALADDSPAESAFRGVDGVSKSGASPYRGTGPGGRAKEQPKTIWERAFYRWAAISVVMGALYTLYFAHPYYRNAQFTAFKTVYPAACGLWLCLGLFYVKATLEKFSERRFTMRDGGLHFVLLAKAFQEKRFWRVAKNRRVRTTLLTIIVKGFFTPLMTGFVVGHLNGISRAWLNHKHLPLMDFKVPAGASILTSLKMWWAHVGVRLADLVPSGHDFAAFVQPWTWTRADVSWGLGISYDLIFAIDCGWALFGYATESRWLGNKTRSVEPTAFGWTVCLACYPPFNNVLGTYLPLENGPQLIASETMHLVLRGGVVFLFAIYAAATVSFGFKFSNLTNRGIVSRGPYRFVRHPAYLCKCAAWWLEHVPTMTITKAFFLTLLCGVYALRAWTEERHLGMDPDYVAYKKKTPWVLFPGIY